MCDHAEIMELYTTEVNKQFLKAALITIRRIGNIQELDISITPNGAVVLKFFHDLVMLCSKEVDGKIGDNVLCIRPAAFIGVVSRVLKHTSDVIPIQIKNQSVKIHDEKINSIGKHGYFTNIFNTWYDVWHDRLSVVETVAQEFCERYWYVINKSVQKNKVYGTETPICTTFDICNIRRGLRTPHLHIQYRSGDGTYASSYVSIVRVTGDLNYMDITVDLQRALYILFGRRTCKKNTGILTVSFKRDLVTLMVKDDYCVKIISTFNC